MIYEKENSQFLFEMEILRSKYMKNFVAATYLGLRTIN